MRLIALILAALVAGCTFPSGSDGSVQPTSKMDAAPVSSSPSGTTSSSTPSTTTPPVSTTPSGKTNSTPESTPVPTHFVNRSFDLSFADAMEAVTPLQNCVFIESSGTRIYNGTATAESNWSVGVNPVELMFRSTGGNASAKGTFPLTLNIPRTNVTSSSDASIALRSSAAGVTRARLDLALEVTGSDPTFTIGGCRAGS